MAGDYLVDSLELDCFDDLSSNSVHETMSDVKTVVLSHCYGRGKLKKDIFVPRLPRGVPTRIVLIPDVDIRKMLPIRKHAGRGRARLLSQNNEVIRPEKPCKEEPLVPRKKSLFELQKTQPDYSSINPGTTDVDSFELYVSEEDGDNDMPLQPPRVIKNHPFGVPPKPKKLFNVKSSEEFPTLGGKDSKISASDVNNSATSARIFPPLPPQLCKKVTNMDIVFKPMKDKKKKKRKENFVSKKTSSRAKSDSISEDCTSLDGDSGNIQSFGSVDDTPSIRESELSPLDAVKRHDSIETWNVCGDNVIQVDGLPNSEDISEFENMFTSYGTVLDVENKLQSNGKCSIRVKYLNEDACDFAVSCLHDSDCVFPDHQLRCYVIPKKNDSE